MDACNEKVDVFKIPFWPFLGGEQGEYFFHFFSNTLYVQKSCVMDGKSELQTH